MAYELAFEQSAIEDLDTLDRVIARRIIRKMKWFASQEQLFAQAKTLTDPAIGEYRFRIGDYRVVCDIRAETIVVLRVGHRKNIYR